MNKKLIILGVTVVLIICIGLIVYEVNTITLVDQFDDDKFIGTWNVNIEGYEDNVSNTIWRFNKENGKYIWNIDGEIGKEYVETYSTYYAWLGIFNVKSEILGETVTFQLVYQFTNQENNIKLTTMDKETVYLLTRI